MKQSDNWQDKLSALKAAMGPTEDDPQETADTAPEVKKETARLDIVLEKKGRAGKCATIVTGFTISDDEIEELASAMKRSLGTGGSARGGEILIQGDRRKDVLRYLGDKGYKARII